MLGLQIGQLLLEAGASGEGLARARSSRPTSSFLRLLVSLSAGSAAPAFHCSHGWWPVGNAPAYLLQQFKRRW